MTILNIIKFPNEKLSNKADLVKKINKETINEIKNMVETLFSHNGLGLAATQVNINKKIIVINMSMDKFIPLVIINPIIINYDYNVISSTEGCLSFPNIFVKIKRRKSISIKFTDTKEKIQILYAESMLSICIQHELDHLNGITLYNKMSNLKKKLLLKK
ncbi:MAG: peptide deformylase [Enterobacteriaceae bacterium]|nr:peptide deformylase [Enterobacteriaceae bacterium]